MSDIESERAAFDARLRARRQARQDEVVSNLTEAAAEASATDLAAAAAAFDARLEQSVARRGAVIGQHDQPPADDFVRAPAARTPIIAPADMEAPIHEWLSAVDQSMLYDFDLARLRLPAGLASPTRWCETPEEFWRQGVAAFGLSRTERTALTQPTPASLAQVGALYLPGKGCLVNAAHFYRDHHTSSLVDVMRQPASRLHLLQEVVQAKWGLGFLAECTALGQVMVAAGLWSAMLAPQLGVRAASLEAQADRLAIVQRSWLLTQAGWCAWVWEYAAHKARHPVGAEIAPRPRLGRTLELLHRLANTFPLIVDVAGIRVRLLGLADLFRFLFLEQSELAPRAVHSVLRSLSRFCTDQGSQFETMTGLRLETLAGWFYLSKIEAALGTFCVPYSLLIACHQTYGLPGASAAKIEKLLESDPRAHVDTRLSMLAGLDSDARYSPRAMFIAAWERLKLDGPKSYFDG